MQPTAVTLACLGMLMMNTLAVAQEPGAQVPQVLTTDLALDASGRVAGTVVDQAGQPSAGRLVRVESQQEVLAEVQTDNAGRFACPVPSGGVYVLQVDGQVTMVRCWLPGSAPPHAVTQLLLQSNGVMRGQISPAGCGLGQPLGDQRNCRDGHRGSRNHQQPSSRPRAGQLTHCVCGADSCPRQPSAACLPASAPALLARLAGIPHLFAALSPRLIFRRCHAAKGFLKKKLR